MLEQVTYDVRGIVWLTSTPLASCPLHFNELDYLFDGLLAKHISNHGELESSFEKNIFCGQSFNRDLVLVQVWSEDKNKIEKELAEALALIPGKGEHPHVLVLGENLKAFSEKVFKKKLDLRFVHLE